MVNRLNFVEKIDRTNSILIDAGNFFPKKEDKVLSRYAMEFFKLLNYDCISLGIQDLKLLDLYKGKIKPVSINYKSDVVDRYYLIKKNGLKIIVTGGISKKYASKNPLTDKIKDINLYINDLKKLKKECDILVFLSNIENKLEDRLFMSIPEIDIFISNSTYNKAKSFKLNHRIFATTGVRSEEMGHVVLNLDNKVLKRSEVKFYDLMREEYPATKEGREIIEKYEEEVLMDLLE